MKLNFEFNDDHDRRRAPAQVDFEVADDHNRFSAPAGARFLSENSAKRKKIVNFLPTVSQNDPGA